MKSNTSSEAPKPFFVHIADETIKRILQRLGDFRWEAFSEPPNAEDWKYGPSVRFMRSLCTYWADEYDWRKQERTMNALSHFMAKTGSVDLHFVFEQGSGDNPMPLLIAHGWPYSFNSYSGIVDRLAHPERYGGAIEDAFSVVVPSFPGYDFSGRPPEPMGPFAIALLFDNLMAQLGFSQYMVHGGDWGAHITSLLALHLPNRVVGIHSTALVLREAGAAQLTGEIPADASEEEQIFIKEEYTLWQHEGAYSMLQATKPAKLGYAMFDSPVGVAAWIVEAFHAWSDRREQSFEQIFTYDQLITEIMLYLVTDSFSTSTWIYGAKQHEEQTIPVGHRVEVPTALAAFRDPVFPMPPLEVAERSHNVVQYTKFPRGGHFPFYEVPDLLVNDLQAFCRLVRR